MYKRWFKWNKLSLLKVDYNGPACISLYGACYIIITDLSKREDSDKQPWLYTHNHRLLLHSSIKEFCTKVYDINVEETKRRVGRVSKHETSSSFHGKLKYVF